MQAKASSLLMSKDHKGLEPGEDDEASIVNVTNPGELITLQPDYVDRRRSALGSARSFHASGEQMPSQGLWGREEKRVRAGEARFGPMPASEVRSKAKSRLEPAKAVHQLGPATRLAGPIPSGLRH